MGLEAGNKKSTAGNHHDISPTPPQPQPTPPSDTNGNHHHRLGLLQTHNSFKKSTAGNHHDISPSPPKPTPPSDANGNHHHHHRILQTHNSFKLQQTPKMMIIFAAVALVCFFLYHSSGPLQLPSTYNPFSGSSSKLKANSDTKVLELKSILEVAAMDNNTVLITTLNDAWAEPNSMFDLFLESFRIGSQTKRFLNHLVVVALDNKAYARCLKLHPHCYYLRTEGMDFSEEAYFMADDYLKMMWRRIDFLRNVLDLGYSFVFTDADIMWFRDPFSHFFTDADFQIACDNFNGNPYDMNNWPNGGFNYVKSNPKTITFYKFWYNSRLNYPGQHDQDVFNKIKKTPFISNINLQIRFLDTAYFGGFCQPSKDLNKACTMHANCCIGLENKVHDLGIMLDDWRKYMKSLKNQTTHEHPSWTVPQLCRGSFDRPRAPKKKDGQGSKN